VDLEETELVSEETEEVSEETEEASEETEEVLEEVIEMVSEGIEEEVIEETEEDSETDQEPTEMNLINDQEKTMRNLQAGELIKRNQQMLKMVGELLLKHPKSLQRLLETAIGLKSQSKEVIGELQM